jgi:hypothetical protein
MVRTSLGFVAAVSCGLIAFGPTVRADELEYPDPKLVEYVKQELVKDVQQRQSLAGAFGVPESRIVSLLDENLEYSEIDHVLMLARGLPDGISDDNVARVLELRRNGLDWEQVEVELESRPAAEPEFLLPPDPEDEAAAESLSRPGTPELQPQSLTRPGKSVRLANPANRLFDGSSGSSRPRAVSAGGSSRPRPVTRASPTSRPSGAARTRSGSQGAKAKGGGKARGRNK